jgi:hypothetical protein
MYKEYRNSLVEACKRAYVGNWDGAYNALWNAAYYAEKLHYNRKVERITRIMLKF